MSIEPVSVNPVIDVRTSPPITRHATLFSMIDALEPVLFMAGFEFERIHFDRFTTSSSASGQLEPARSH